MKFPALLAFVLAVGASVALADIQSPPASDYGPTRKLGRGLANIAFGSSELIDSFVSINYSEGNAAAFSYGIVRGTGRSLARLGFGIYEVALFPFPTYKGSYRPPYKSDIPWIHCGYSEFPPELGFETRYNYVRDYQQSPSL
ncbi:MAG TPA: exosortase system-associated protein, TIGR04073 family [Chthoniobacterales bacterium]|jgi:putative exosortase-associated protein (TIGR04073 family)